MRLRPSKMQVNATMLGSGFHSARTGTARFGGEIQRPIASFPIVDASEFKLGQGAQHRLSSSRDQKRPVRQLGRRKFPALPDFTRRIDQQIAAIFATQQSSAFIRQRQMSA